MDEHEDDNSDMISGLLMEQSHHSSIVYLSICVPSHCPQQTLINICVLDERANLPLVRPLTPYTPNSALSCSSPILKLLSLGILYTLAHIHLASFF